MHTPQAADRHTLAIHAPTPPGTATNACGPQSRSQHWQHTRLLGRARGCAEAYTVSGVDGHQTPTHTTRVPVPAFRHMCCSSPRWRERRAEPATPHDRQAGHFQDQCPVECLLRHTNLGGLKVRVSSVQRVCGSDRPIKPGDGRAGLERLSCSAVCSSHQHRKKIPGCQKETRPPTPHALAPRENPT